MIGGTQLDNILIGGRKRRRHRTRKTHKKVKHHKKKTHRRRHRKH